MTTSSRMNNFKLLVERFSRGEKLLTTQEKLAVMKHSLHGVEKTMVEYSETYRPRFQQVRLVLKLHKKNRSH